MRPCPAGYGHHPVERSASADEWVPVAPASDGEKVDQTDIADIESVEHMV